VRQHEEALALGDDERILLAQRDMVYIYEAKKAWHFGTICFFDQPRGYMLKSLTEWVQFNDGGREGQ
jgi:hypothetical protein